jgi:60 kDa SS-A/Ro ribonucleoprotein
MRVNATTQRPATHAGGPAITISPIFELRRTVLACLLWEDGFYESGATVADRIKQLVPQCKPYEVADLAIEARQKHRLRHVPLLLVRELARDSKRCPDGLVASTLETVIQRADELSEFLAMYWLEEKASEPRARKPLAKQVKVGLANAFRKFDEYALAKYNRDNAIKLRDVLFMVHAKPKDEAQAALWKRLVDGKLSPAGTWEERLSAGQDKRTVFEDLLAKKELGYLALLRNLRNMQAARVDEKLVFAALADGAAKSNALPFRFVAAARAVPSWEPAIDQAMQMALSGLDKLPGKTAVLVDVSGSMEAKLSSKSDLTRLDAAAALAVLVRGICSDVRVYKFNFDVDEVPARQGMALVDAIGKPLGGTYLGRAVTTVRDRWPQMERLIVFTDEESADPVGAPGCKGYMVNVATTQNAVGFGDWTRVNGFSEAVVQFIAEMEHAGQ